MYFETKASRTPQIVPVSSLEKNRNFRIVLVLMPQGCCCVWSLKGKESRPQGHALVVLRRPKWTLYIGRMSGECIFNLSFNSKKLPVDYFTERYNQTFLFWWIRSGKSDGLARIPLRQDASRTLPQLLGLLWIASFFHTDISLEIWRCINSISRIDFSSCLCTFIPISFETFGRYSQWVLNIFPSSFISKLSRIFWKFE